VPLTITAPALHPLQSYRTHQYEQQALSQRLASYSGRQDEQAARQREAREAAKVAAGSASRQAKLEAIQRAAAHERAKQQRVGCWPGGVHVVWVVPPAGCMSERGQDAYRPHQVAGLLGVTCCAAR
jgi:hypothetical protein